MNWINRQSASRLMAIVILIGAAVYSNSLFNSFVWDDEEQIVQNVLVHSIKNLPGYFSGSTFNTGGAGGLTGIYYKPMMTSLFSLVYTFFGPRPFFFHFLQTMIHLMNIGLIFGIFNKLLTKNAAFWATLIFAVHPINVESVAYISALQDVLFAFFGLLGLISLIKAKKATAIFGLWLLSLLSKETGIIFLAIGAVYIILYRKNYLQKYLAGAVILILVYLFLRLGLAHIPFASQDLSPITRVSLKTRVLAIPKIVEFYLITYLYPKDLIIAQHWIVEKINWNDFWKPLTIIGGVGAIGGMMAIKQLKNDKKNRAAAGFFGGWFLTGLGIHLQIFPLDMTVADRWFYLSQVGFLGMTASILTIDNRKWKKIFGLLAIFGILLLSARTIRRNMDWKNGLTLFGHDITLAGESFDLQNNYGVELFRTGNLEQAKIHFEKSTQLAPFWWTNWNNLGVTHQREGDIDKAGVAYQKAIDNGDYYLAWENLAFIKLNQEDNLATENFLAKGLSKLPMNENLLIAMSMVKQKLGKSDEAVYFAQRAYQITPSPRNGYILQKLIAGEEIQF